MPVRVDIVYKLVDQTTASFRSMKIGFDKVNESARKTQTAINQLPNSIGSLEKKLDSLKRKQKDSWSVEGIKHYQKEINATEKQLSRLNSMKHGGGLKGFMGQVGDQVPGVGGLMSTLTSPAAIGIGAGLVVAQTLYSATEKAMLFEQGMAKVNGTLLLTKPELEKVKNELLKLGTNSTTDLNLIPDTFNKIVSAGLDLPNALDVMDKSLKGAKAGFTDVNNVADATTNIMNSVGKSNTNATEVMDVLFATLNKGKGEFVDVANYLPKLIPISNQLGLSFKETSGAFAFLTANGLKAEASTTALQNVFNSLKKNEIRQNLKAIGVNVFDASGKMRSLKDISQELSKSLEGLTDEQRIKKLESLGLDQEAALGLGLMSQNAKDLATSIDYVANSSGELERTLIATDNPMNKVKLLSNQFEGIMTKIGYAILPAVNSALEKALGWITGLVDGISSAYKNSELFRDIISGIGETLSLVWKGATIYFSQIGDQFDKTTKQMEEYGYSWAIMGENLDAAYTWHKNQVKGFVSGTIAILNLLKEAWDNLWSGKADPFKNLSFKKIQETFNKGYYDVINNKSDNSNSSSVIPSIVKNQYELFAKMKASKTNITPPKPPFLPNNNYSGGGNGSLDNGIESVSTGGREQKVININLGKFMDNLNINSQNLTEGIGEMQGKVEECLLRVLNGANNVQYG
jgi:TP901 family phage tail tape measure protein